LLIYYKEINYEFQTIFFEFQINLKTLKNITFYLPCNQFQLWMPILAGLHVHVCFGRTNNTTTLNDVMTSQLI